MSESDPNIIQEEVSVACEMAEEVRRGSRRLSQNRGNRLLSKSGKVNLRSYKVPQKRERFLADFFTSLIDAKWRWVIALYSAGFIFSWSFFGTVWFVVFWLRLNHDNGVTCVDNVDSWTSAFLFSVETQTTIGYGGRQITPQCPEAVVCLLLQSLTGFLLSTSLLGLVFAKLSRPRPRAQTVMFSKHAVVAPYDGFLSLMFRVGDVRKSQLLDVAISVHCFCFRTTATGEEILVSQQELPITTEHGIEFGEQIKPFFLLPLTVVHVIDSRSPLYELGAQELANSRMEIIAVLEGVVESTSMVTQAKTSFLAEEILWGQRFHPISFFRGKKADLSSFDKTYRVKTPVSSPKEYERSHKKGIEIDENKKTTKESIDVSNGGADCQVWIRAEPEPESPSDNHKTCNNNSDIV